MRILEKLIDLPQKCKVALYGLGMFSQYINFLITIKRKDIEVLFFIDPNKTSDDISNTIFNGKTVLSLNSESDLLDEVDYILICDDYDSIPNFDLPEYFIMVSLKILYTSFYEDMSLIFKRQNVDFDSFLIENTSFVKADTQYKKPFISYNGDSLVVLDKCLGFKNDTKFLSAYENAIKLDTEIVTDVSYRTYIACWAAKNAKKLEGDFVECGVNRGILSKTIVDYIDFKDIKDKKFYLFDTYEGLVEGQQIEEVEKKKFLLWKNYYSPCYEDTQKTFKEYENVILVKGIVPDSLKEVEIEKVSYLSIDMNCAYPEIEAIKYFWPKLVNGAIVILDDYAWKTHEPQKEAFDKFCIENNAELLTLPTGQGMIIKN